MGERRKHRRLLAQPSVQYRLPGEGRPLAARATGIDISLGGVRILAERMLKIGTELHLKIELAGTGKTLHAVGRVSWQKKMSDRAYETGVEFKPLSDEGSAVFTEFVFHEMHTRTGRCP